MIERDAAIAIARARAEQNGWPFSEPLYIVHRKLRAGDRFEIETNAGMLGTKARFAVDAETGAILSEGYIRR